VQDGDFLVRESQGSPGQYVLTGLQSGVKKHLLLVDPEGVVSFKKNSHSSHSSVIFADGVLRRFHFAGEDQGQDV
jgi:SHC-transforming protein 1